MTSGQVLGEDGVTVGNMITIGSVASFSANATIASWNFFGESSPTTSTADFVSSNLDGPITLSRGAGAASSSGGNSFRTTGFQNNGISTANTDYFEFTVSASAGNILNLSSLGGNAVGTATFTTSPGVSFQYAYSLNSGAYSLIGSPSVRIGDGALPAIDLTGVTALQNLAASDTIAFRLYASGQTATGGWGYSSPDVSTNGLTVAGSFLQPASGTGTLGITNAGSTVYSGGVIVNNTATLTAGTGGTATFNGSISGNGSITKTGAGVVELAVGNTYSGGTTISAGTLNAANASALGTGTVSVAGGTLATTVVNVDMGNNLNVSSGAFSLNGASTGTLNLSTGADLLISGGTWNLSIASLGSFDRIIGGGGLTSEFSISGAVLNLSGSISNGSYNILSNFTGGTGTFSSFTGLGVDQTAFTSIDGGILTLTVVPEPHEYAMMIAGLLGVLIVIRRMRQNRSANETV